MKNTMTNKNMLTALTGLFVVSFLVVGAFSLTLVAHAQEDNSDSGCCGGSDAYGVDYSYTPSYDYSSDYGGSDAYGIDYSYPASYDTYSSGGYGSSYYGGSYLGGSGYIGAGYITGGGYGTGYSNTNVNTNTNTNIIDNGNSCTAGNSCNTNIVTTTTNPAPVIINNTTPSYNYQSCTTCGCPGYASCYQQPVVYSQPVAYNTTPYVSLTQVPYTGLDLGFWGTIAYWGFLILWCLAAAYLIVVKRVQMRVYRAMKSFLFGAPIASASQKSTDLPSVSRQTFARQTAASAVAAKAAPAYSTVDATDSFILSQVHRSRTA